MVTADSKKREEVEEWLTPFLHEGGEIFFATSKGQVPEGVDLVLEEPFEKESVLSKCQHAKGGHPPPM